MQLDPAHPEDAPAMAAVHAASFDAPWEARALATALDGPGAFGFVVRAPSIVAFIVAHAILDEAEILTLAVDPSVRRQGVGAALLEAALGSAAHAGAKAVFLEVAADNDAALALYRGAGFVEAGTRRGYYPRAAGAVDALVLRRDLNSARP